MTVYVVYYQFSDNLKKGGNYDHPPKFAKIFLVEEKAQKFAEEMNKINTKNIELNPATVGKSYFVHSVPVVT